MKAEDVSLAIIAFGCHVGAYIACCLVATILYVATFQITPNLIANKMPTLTTGWFLLVFILMFIYAMPTAFVTVVGLRIAKHFDFLGYAIGGAICPYVIQLETGGFLVPNTGFFSLLNFVHAPLGVASAWVFWFFAIRPTRSRTNQTENLSGLTE